MKDTFQQSKDSILNDREDKSHEGKWDDHISELCEKINLDERYFTTSSCSGRIVLVKDQEKKDKDVFLFKSHEKVGIDDLWKFFETFDELKVFSRNILFKQEPPILHVACRSLEEAQGILDKAKLVGWKRSGIIGTTKGKFLVELNSTEKLEFPLIKDGKILVDDEFMKIVIEKANKNLEKGWDKIERLMKVL